MLPAADEADELQDHDQRAGRGLGKGESAHHLRMRQPAVNFHLLLRDIKQHRIRAAKGDRRSLAEKQSLLRLRPRQQPCRSSAHAGSDLSSKTWTRKVGLVVLNGLFEGQRGLEAEGAVESHWVVKGLDVVEDHGASLGARGRDEGAQALGL